jgi:hypothetical protein
MSGMKRIGRSAEMLTMVERSVMGSESEVGGGEGGGRSTYFHFD